MCCMVVGVDLGRGLLVLCRAAVAGSMDSVLSGMLSPLLHMGQGTAGESPSGEVNAAQVQPLWGVGRCCGTCEE